MVRVDIIDNAGSPTSYTEQTDPGIFAMSGTTFNVYNKPKYIDSFTDDASVVEKMGEKIFMVEGNIENIKITTPVDLLFANCLINQKTNS